MLKMWDCALFNQHMITKWTIKPEGDKTYINTVNFFNKKVNNLEAYEAANCSYFRLLLRMLPSF